MNTIRKQTIAEARSISQKINKPFFSPKGRKRGQSLLEYSFVILCIVAALLAMKTYTTRGIQGRLRGAVDNLGEQYAPLSTTSDIKITIRTDIDTVTKTLSKGDEGYDEAKYGDEDYTETTTTYNYDTQEYVGKETMENAGKKSLKSVLGSVQNVIDRIFKD